MPTTTVERLLFEIGGDAAKLKPPTDQASKMLDGVNKSADQANASVSRTAGGFKMLGTAAAGFVSIGLAKEFVAMADSAKLLEGRLRLVTKNSAELANVQRELFRIAQDNAQEIEGTTTLYTKLARVGGDLGASQAQLFKFTEGVSQALRIQGTTSAEASGSLLQLGQALGGGVIQAQEFNSLIDGAPRLLQAVAEGMGKTGMSVSQLKKEVNAGNVTSKEFFEAFLRGADSLKAEAAKMPDTVGGSFVKLKNIVFDLVGKFDEAAGLTAALSHALGLLAAQADNGESFATRSGTAWGKFGHRVLEINSLIAQTGELVFGTAIAMAGLLSFNDDRTTKGLERMRVAMEQIKVAAKNINDIRFGDKAGPSILGASDFGSTPGAGTGKPTKTIITPIDKEAADKAKKALDDVRKSVEDLTHTLDDTGPVATFRAKMDEFEKSAKAAKLPAKELAAAMAVLNGIMVKVKQTAADAAGDDLRTLLAGLTISNVDDLTVALDLQVSAMRRKAQAELASLDGDHKGAMAALQAADAVEAQGREIIEATKALEELQALKDTIAKRADDGAGNVASQFDLAFEKQKLEALRDQLTDKKAIKLLDEAIADLKNPTYEIDKRTDDVTSAIAEKVGKIAGATEEAARFAFGLAQAFGTADTSIAKTLAGVLSVAGGIRSLSESAEKAGGYGKLLSSAGGVASSLPAIGGIIGGGIAIGKALFAESPEDKQARELQKQNTHALQALTVKIGDLATTSITANDYAGLQKVLNGVFSLGVDVTGGTPTGGTAVPRTDYGGLTKPNSSKIDIGAQLTAVGMTQADLERVASELHVTLDGTVGSLGALQIALNMLDFKAFTNTVSGLSSQFELLRKFDKDATPERSLQDTKKVLTTLGSSALQGKLSGFDASTEEGRSALRAYIVDLTKQMIAGNAEAFKMLGDLSYPDFLNLVSSLVGGIDDITSSMANGLDVLTPALQRLNERATLFGYTAAQTLDGTIAAYSAAFPQIANMLAGFAGGTKESIAAAVTNFQNLYDTITTDDIDDTLQQPLIDAILAIVGALRTSSDDILTIAEELAQRGKEISDAFTANQAQAGQYLKFHTAYGAKTDAGASLATTIASAANAGVDVAGSDISSRGGLLSFRDKITAQYDAMAEDGIDATEQAIADVLSGILDGIDGAIAQFDDSAAGVTQRANDAVTKRVSNAGTLDRALGTSADQSIVNKAGAYGGALVGLINDLGDVSPEQIGATTTALQGFLQSALNGTLPLEMLGDLTQDQFVNAVIELLSGVGDITDGFSSAADQLKADAADIQGFQFNTIDAQGGDTRVSRFDYETQQQRDKYVTAGKDAGYLAAYDEMRSTQRGTLLRDIAVSMANSVAESVASSAGASGARDPRTDFSNSAVKSITSVQALGIGDTLSSINVNVRDILGEMRSSRAPAMPQGGFGNVTNTGAVTYNNHINITVPGGIMGGMMGDAAKNLAKELLPHIDRGLGRSMIDASRQSGNLR